MIIAILILLFISLLLFWKTLILQDQVEHLFRYLSEIEKTVEHIEKYLDDKDSMWRLF